MLLYENFCLRKSAWISVPNIWFSTSVHGRNTIYRVRHKNLTIFKLKWNEKYAIFLLKFITKIIFNSKHFNYNIHFLNIVSVKWRPMSTPSPKVFLEVLHHSLHHAGRNCCHFLPWCSVSNPLLSLVSFRTPCSWDIIRGKSIATRDTRSNEYWNCRRIILWIKIESLFLKIVSTAKARCSIDQRSLANEMLWVSLEERSGTNSPRQWFNSQLFCQIVMYFCRTLYYAPVSHGSVMLLYSLHGSDKIT